METSTSGIFAKKRAAGFHASSRSYCPDGLTDGWRSHEDLRGAHVKSGYDLGGLFVYLFSNVIEGSIM